MRLTGKDGLFPEEDQYDVCAARCGDHLVETAFLLTAVRQAGNIVHPAREALPQGRQRRDRVLLLSVESPGAQLVVRGIGHRTRHEDASGACRVKRQEARILEQDGRLLCRAARGVEVLRRILHRLCGSGIHVGMLEEAEQDLDAQDVPYRRVNGGFLHFPAANQLLEVGNEPIGHHIHVHTGIQRLAGHFLAVCAVTVRDHFAHGVPVGHHHPVEAPLIPEDILEDEAVARRGDAVVVIERSH